jgi:hypothetical protein
MPVMTNLPDYAVWAVDSLQTVMLLLTGSLLLLGGQALISLSVLARPAARRLSMILMLNLGLLLLPVRDLGITTLLVVPVFLFNFRYLSLLRQSTPAMRTTEGVVAGLLVMLPLAIMVGRGAYLYAEGAVAIGSLSLVAYLILRQAAVSITRSSRLRRILEISSLLPSLVTALKVTEMVDGLAPLSDQWLMLIFASILVLFLLDLAIRSQTGREYYLRSIFYTWLAMIVLQAFLWPGIASAMVAITISGLSLLYGYATEEKYLLRLSLATLLGSMVLLVSEVILSIN